MYTCQTPLTGNYVRIQKDGSQPIVWHEIRAYETAPMTLTESILSANLMPNTTLLNALSLQMTDGKSLGLDAVFSVTATLSNAYWSVNFGQPQKLKAVLIMGQFAQNGQSYTTNGLGWKVTFGNSTDPCTNPTIYTQTGVYGGKEILVESIAQYLAVCKPTGTLSLSLVSVFKYPCELDCSAASLADQVYYIRESITLYLSACVGSKAATVTATLTSTLPTGFATITKEADNSFTILLSSQENSIVGQSYQFQLLFSEPTADGICQPNAFKVQVKCTKTVDCSASTQSNFTYLLTQSTNQIIPACVVSPDFCQNTSEGTLTSTPSAGFGILTKNTNNNSFILTMLSNDVATVGQTYTFTLKFTDTSVTSVTQPSMATFNVQVMCSLDCSRSGQVDITYFIQDTTTRNIPACIMNPSTCIIQSTYNPLSSVGTTQPPTGFVVLIRNPDSSFTITINSSDLSITNKTYQFQLNFQAQNGVFVHQPSQSVFNVSVKCTKTIDCSAELEDFVYFLAEETLLNLKACKINPVDCPDTTQVIFTQMNPISNFITPTTDKYVFRIFSNDSKLIDQKYQLKLEFQNPTTTVIPTITPNPVITVKCKVKEVTHKNNTQASFNYEIGQPAQLFDFVEFEQTPVCNFEWTYQLTLIEINTFTQDVNFTDLIKTNPKIEGSMPLGLGRLSNKSVYIKTDDISFLGKIYGAFISGTLSTNLLYQAPLKKNFELTRFKVIQQKFLVANHAPIITDYGLQFFVQAGEQKIMTIADVTDQDNIEKLQIELSTSCNKNLPDWIKLSFVNFKVMLEYQVPKDVQDDVCTVNVKVSDNDTNSPMTAEKKIQIDVLELKSEKVDSPTFKTKLADVFVVKGNNFRIRLPEQNSSDSSVTLHVDLNEAKDFAQYESSQGSIYIVGSKSTIGQFEIKVKLTNANNQFTENSFQLFILENFKGLNQKNPTKSSRGALRQLFAKIVEITPSGKVKINFSEKIISKDKDLYLKIDEALEVTAMAFDFNLGYSIPVKLKSHCVLFENSLIELQLTFENPAGVSNQIQLDKLNVKFINEQFFMTEQDLIVIEPDLMLSENIPAQFTSKQQQEFIKASSNVTKGTGYAVIIGIILGQLFGKEVIKRIWSLFSCMQIVILMNEYSTISMPAIAKQTIEGIDGIMKLSALDVKILAAKLGNEKIVAYIEDPKRLINSFNPLLLIVISVIGLGAVVTVFSVCINKWKNQLPERFVKIIDKIKAQFIFNLLISSLQVGYLNLWISINLKTKQNIKDCIRFAGQKTKRMLSDEELIQKRTLVTNFLISFCFSSGLIAALALITRLIKRNPLEYFELQTTKDKVGALYKDFAIDSKPALYYASFFLARRMFVAAVFVFVETIVLKVELIVLSCFVALYYLIKYSPYQNPIDLKIEILNETGLLLANVWCLAFSDILFDSPQQKIKLSKVYVAIFTILIVANLYLFVKRTAYVFLNEWFKKRQQKKHVLQLEEARLLALAERQQNLQAQIVGDIENRPVYPQTYPKLLSNIQTEFKLTNLKSSLKISEKNQTESKQKEKQQKKLNTSKQNKSLKSTPRSQTQTKTNEKQFKYQNVSDIQLVKSTGSITSIQSDSKNIDSSRKQAVKEENFAFYGDIQGFSTNQRREYFQKLFSGCLELNQFQWKYILKPKDETWMDRAIATKKIYMPKHLDPVTARTFIFQEACDQCIQESQAQVLVQRFIACTGKNPNTHVDDLITRQVIWLIEGAKQREFERLQNELDLLKQLWERELREKEEEEKLAIEHHYQIIDNCHIKMKVDYYPHIPLEMIPEVKSRIEPALATGYRSRAMVQEMLKQFDLMKENQLLVTSWDLAIGEEVFYAIKDIQLEQEYDDYKIRQKKMEEKWIQLEIDNLADQEQIKQQLRKFIF